MKIKPSNNIIIAYSMNPQSIIQEFEQKTPNFQRRLDSLKRIQNNGWKIGLRFDPIFISEKNIKDYYDFVEKIFSTLKGSLVHSVTIGRFRMSQAFSQK